MKNTTEKIYFLSFSKKSISEKDTPSAWNLKAYLMLFFANFTIDKNEHMHISWSFVPSTNYGQTW